MPDFGRPEYASYVKLCRELRLKRPLHEMPKPFQPYQEFYGWDQLEAGGMVYSYGLAQDFDASVIQEEADPIWLPTLADWLERLSQHGEWALWQEGLMPDDSGRVRYAAELDLPSDPAERRATGDYERAAATPEEAAARLWIAVTQPTPV